ncbi:MAG TPA: PQQ-binding-like beta-propeller repeat protein [Kofleriaceae bacterium]|jgi:hypothetical protein
MRGYILILLAAACGSDPPPTDATATAPPEVIALTALGSVLTQHNDAARTGLNPNETKLTIDAVTNNFGDLFEIPVDGPIYAQPLVALNVTTPSGVRDMLYVATSHDTVYGFDADTGVQVWSFNAGTPEPASAAYPPGKRSLAAIGITGTPVIDPTTGVIYFVATTQLSAGVYRQHLYALNIADGTTHTSPRVMVANTPGTNASGAPITIQFDPGRENQRPGLLLKNSRIYIGWAGHYGDYIHDPNEMYEGWIMSYDATTLALLSQFTTATHYLDPGSTPPTPYGSGIWMSGTGLATDGGHLYVATGNGKGGTDPSNPLTNNYGDMILELDNTLHVTDWFQMYNHNQMDQGDLDAGAGGVVVIPDPVGGYSAVTFADKWGDAFVLDRQNLGKYQQNNHTCGSGPGMALPTCALAEIDNAVGSEDDNAGGRVSAATYYGAPAYFNNHVYFAGWGDSLRRFELGVGTGFHQDFASTDTFNYPGATPSISSNGTTQGIVWAIDRTAVGPFTTPDPAHLRAYTASNLTRIFSTVTANDPDAPNQFMTPTIANGHVYVAGAGVTVYGLLLTVIGGGPVTRGNSISLTLAAAARAPTTSYALSATGMPAGMTVSFGTTTLASGATTSVTVQTTATTPVGTYAILLHGGAFDTAASITVQ